MTIAYTLTQELRLKLKEPLGTLIRGSYTETMRKLRTMIEDERPPCLVSVGDAVSKNLEKSRLFTRLSVVDNKTMRKTIRPVSVAAQKTMYVENPPATITEEAVEAIQESLKAVERTRIVVDGEEDLLALVAISHAPENSFVVYGQPREGIVVVKVTPNKKAEVAEILKIMKNARKAK